ncbi:MAG: hypothetical protein JNJ73_16435 [Hyphomonadaceae bacterium]|nr:hypothetical protein [Hyphomonadaceae bacterium]
MRLLWLSTLVCTLLIHSAALSPGLAATPGATRASEPPTIASEPVIASAQRIKAALISLQPCPSADVARYAIGIAAEGVKLEILLLALELSKNDEALCRGARRGIARAIDDARLALAALGPTGATSGETAAPAPGAANAGPSTPGRSVGFGRSLGGLPGGAGGSGYRPGV